MKTDFGAWFPQPFPAYGFASVEQFDAFKKKLPALVRAVDKFGSDSPHAVAVAGKMPFRLVCDVGGFNVPFLGDAPPEKQISLTRAFAESLPLYLKERGLYELNDFRKAVNDWDNLKIKDFMARLGFYAVATGSQGFALHFRVLQAAIMGRHDNQFKSFNLLAKGLSDHWLQHLEFDSGMIGHMEISAAQGRAVAVGISEAKRFCKLRGLEPAELDGLLRDGVITFSQVVAALGGGQAVAVVPIADESLDTDPLVCSRRLAREFAETLQGNLNGLELVKPAQIWKSVYRLRTGESAPKKTPQRIPGLFAWTFEQFQEWYRYNKCEFFQWVMPPISPEVHGSSR